MDSKGKRQKLRASEIADPSLSKKKKKQKVNASPCASKMKVLKAMKKQNDVAMFLAGKVISAVAKNSNFVFSPASINAVLTMAAATAEDETLRSSILSFLRSSSVELNAIFREIASVVLVDGSESGAPKIAVVNGVWIEQSLSVNSSSKDLFVNFFKADFAQA